MVGADFDVSPLARRARSPLAGWGVALGRAIERTAPFRGDVCEHGEKAGEVVDQLRWLASIGLGTVFGRVVGVDRITPLEIMGREVIPAVADQP